jgi:hypothetical protein
MAAVVASHTSAFVLLFLILKIQLMEKAIKERPPEGGLSFKKLFFLLP